MSDFKEQIENANKAIIDFYAEWCGPCKMMEPTIEKIKEEHNGVDVIKLNIEENQKLASEYGIKTIPTLVYIKKGEEIHRESGGRSEDNIRKAIESYLS